jgi:3-oxoacyl-[acyl-carrier protein] reductase
MELHLKDKVAVITGGSIGIGLAIAEGLANEGTHLLLVARQPQRLNAEAERIKQLYGVRALGVSADVVVAKDIEEVVRVVEREFGGADILINNAGTGSNETIMEAPDEKWQFYWEST